MFEIVFKALGEPTRLKIIKLLAERELCVCDLEEVMQISQPRISQHLKVLKHAGLVNERKEGQRNICSLNRDLLFNIIEDFQQYIDQPLEGMAEFSEEYTRLPEVVGDYCEKKNCGKL
ncbi:MAG: winged helix-turn-helix transcriptional regulator [Syntrophomonadaceae bacterium]|nr:winged helix-turn-helix transcriptional regulator [Syntrophomonadaceae bacterium]